MTTTGPSTLKIIKLLEWCTEIPTLDNPRQSPVFLLNNNEWFFLLKTEDYGCYLYLKLKQLNKEVEPCNVTLQVGFKYEEKLSLDRKEICITSELKNYIYMFNSGALQSKLPSDYTMGNFLKFVFRFESMNELYLKDDDGSDDEYVQAPSDANTLLESMSNDFSKLLDDGLNHDVEFMCGDETYKAHKSILCCRSDVFAAMLQSDMVEGKTGRITIPDMNATTFQQFLTFLYSTKLHELTLDTAVSLYKAGDKYHVDSLKKHCAEYLLVNLTPENFSDSLILADLHNDAEFKKAIIKYIIKQKIQYSGEKWTDFCKENPVLAIEVLNFFCQQVQPK